MAKTSYDQSSSVKCPIHGKRIGIFVKPDANEAFPAFYTCLHCTPEQFRNATITREQALTLNRLK